MGFLSSFFWNEDQGSAYEQGMEWAETLVDVDADLSPGQGSRMADDLGGNHANEFYEGLRDGWNAQPDVEPERGFLRRLFG